MDRQTSKISHRQMRHRRTRADVSGTSKKPRVTVFKSNKNIFIQLVDDVSGKTLLSNASAMSAKGKKTDKAMILGEAVGKKAIDKGIKEVIFDKSGYKYHGRIRAVAEGLRKSGLKF
jgi:large subunit ribosomal protein L18